jgi:MFS transporter, ACS family, glucarate transporter
MANRVRVQTNVVGLMVAFSVMSYFDRTIMSIAGPGMMKEFALSAPQMGAVYTAFLISYAAMNLPGGYLADRFGPRAVLTVVGLGAGLFTALTALGGKPGLGVFLGVVPSFFLLRFGLGICTGPLYPTCARTMASWIPHTQHARIWGFIAAGAGLGGATSPLLFSWMIGRYGWRMSFCMAGVATAVLALIWFWYVRDHPSQHPSITDAKNAARERIDTGEQARKTEPTPWARLLTNGNLILLSLGYFAVSYFDYVYFFWIYYYLGEIRHLEPQQSAVATTIVLLTWMAMSPLGGWVSDLLVKRYGDKVGRRIVPVVSLTLSGVLLCIAINLTGMVASVALLSLSFGFASCSDGPYWAAAISVGGRHAGAVCGILNTSGNLGGVAPYIAPVIATYAGWSWGLYSASLVLLIAVLTWFFIDPTKIVLSEAVVKLQKG